MVAGVSLVSWRDVRRFALLSPTAVSALLLSSAAERIRSVPRDLQIQEMCSVTRVVSHNELEA